MLGGKAHSQTQMRRGRLEILDFPTYKIYLAALLTHMATREAIQEFVWRIGYGCDSRGVTSSIRKICRV